MADTPPAGAFLQGSVRQWAVEATASSEYADPEWAAIQATGAPDTSRCGDYQTAWASVGADTVEWLELKFSVPVFVTGVRIIQTFNPNQVARVELLGAGGRVRQIYKADPQPVDQPCPYELLIPVERTRAKYDTVRITVDQSVLGLGWNEIDAVELVGDE
ncbi:MAG: hypothetical protein D6803_05550 [Anaerolineae bacterium]|nr:MAG: hypothetical protein D6803_05550 [Anaerolineae bacterium]